MTEKIFDVRTIILSDGVICFELDRIVLNDGVVDILAFHLTHFPCENPKNTFVDEHKFFNKINELDNYINAKISGFYRLGFK